MNDYKFSRAFVVQFILKCKAGLNRNIKFSVIFTDRKFHAENKLLIWLSSPTTQSGSMNPGPLSSSSSTPLGSLSRFIKAQI